MSWCFGGQWVLSARPSFLPSACSLPMQGLGTWGNVTWVREWIPQAGRDVQWVGFRCLCDPSQDQVTKFSEDLSIRFLKRETKLCSFLQKCFMAMEQVRAGVGPSVLMDCPPVGSQIHSS